MTEITNVYHAYRSIEFFDHKVFKYQGMVLIEHKDFMDQYWSKMGIQSYFLLVI